MESQDDINDYTDRFAAAAATPKNETDHYIATVTKMKGKKQTEIALVFRVDEKLWVRAKNVLQPL